MLLDGLGWSHYSVFTLYYDSNPRSRTVWGGIIAPIGISVSILLITYKRLLY